MLLKKVLKNCLFWTYRKKIVLISSKENFFVPFLKASELTPKNGGEGSISILVSNSYKRSFNILLLGDQIFILYIRMYELWSKVYFFFLWRSVVTTQFYSYSNRFCCFNSFSEKIPFGLVLLEGRSFFKLNPFYSISLRECFGNNFNVFFFVLNWAYIKKSEAIFRGNQ